MSDSDKGETPGARSHADGGNPGSADASGIAQSGAAEAPEHLSIRRPDDWHLHLRDGAMLATVVPYTARIFARAVVMPNLAPPITTVAMAQAYAARIRSAMPEDSGFRPLMTLYLTDETTPEEIERAAAAEDVVGVKLYPKGATTNSASGVTGLGGMQAVLATLERTGLPLLIHGESTRPEDDVFDRERVFLEDTLAPLVERFAGLRVVFEHITTAEAAQFVEHGPDRLAATITPQHLLLNRNAIFEGGIRPHRYCLPVLKRERDRQALVRVATSGHRRFFLGTDSAPHVRGAKESACGCAGIFSAPVAMEAYAEAFARAGALDRLEAFASENGADFYGLARNEERLQLSRVDHYGPRTVGQGDEAVEVFWAGEGFRYRCEPPSGDMR